MTTQLVVDRAHENALIDAYNKEMVMRDYDNMELLQDVPDGVTGNFLEFVQDKKNIVPLKSNNTASIIFPPMFHVKHKK